MLGKFFIVGAFLWSSLALADGVQKNVFESDFPIMPKAECKKLVAQQAKKGNGLIDDIGIFYKYTNWDRTTGWRWKSWNRGQGYYVLHERKNKDVNGLMIGNEEKTRKLFARLNKDNGIPKKLTMGEIIEEGYTGEGEFLEGEDIFIKPPSKGMHQRVTEIGTKNGKCYVKKAYAIHPKSAYLIFDKDFCKTIPKAETKAEALKSCIALNHDKAEAAIKEEAEKAIAAAEARFSRLSAAAKAGRATKQDVEDASLQIQATWKAARPEALKRAAAEAASNKCVKKVDTERLTSLKENWEKHAQAWHKESGLKQKLSQTLGPVNDKLLKSSNELAKTCEAYDVLETQEKSLEEKPQQTPEKSRVMQ